MRLLHATTLQFHEFQGSDIPPYAILSHRWEDEEEVTHQEMRGWWRGFKMKRGIRKVKECCQQAVKDGLYYVWVDTCCIDKTSSAELSEAINSMYRWYQNSATCYAYLSDVHVTANNRTLSAVDFPSRGDSLALPAQFLARKWWTRGWTLQELIAPRIVRFYANDQHHAWVYIGDKSTLLHAIARKTSIDVQVLNGLDVRQCSIANRMSWASARTTTRIEDMAYCLLGLFSINMPLLYGEGDRAFIRLQVWFLEPQ
jgi:hypothetical protein